jgi:hypothetical protein
MNMFTVVPDMLTHTELFIMSLLFRVFNYKGEAFIGTSTVITTADMYKS